jgi:predicted Zn-dependent peptidase
VSLARSSSRALAVLAAIALLGASPRFPQATQTDLGNVKLFAENDAGAQLGGLQLSIGAGLDRQTPSSSGVAALTAECVLRTPLDGVQLRDAIAAAGGSIQYTVDGRSTRFYVEGRPDALPALLGLLGRALGAPDFSAPTVAAARASLAQRAKDVETTALSAAIEMFRRAYYATGAGLPALGSVSTLATLSGDEVRAFYQADYRRGGAVASAVGRETPALAPAVRDLLDTLPAGAAMPVAGKANPISQSGQRIVARRDVAAPMVVIGFGAPDPGNADFGAMLVLESLLANTFERASTTSLGLRDRSVGAFYLYDGSPASLVVYVNGNRVDPSLALRGVLLLASSLGKRPLGASTLARLKVQAEGSFVTDSVSLSDRAYLLGTFGALGLGADPVNAALGSIERTTPADVRRVAQRYLQRYIVAFVLPRQAPAGT